MMQQIVHKSTQRGIRSARRLRSQLSLPSCQRLLSSSSTSYSLEYPLRTEAPIITRSVAPSSSVDEESKFTPVIAAAELKSDGVIDHFDDGNQLTAAQRHKLLNDQKSSISSKLTPASNRPISSTDDYYPSLGNTNSKNKSRSKSGALEAPTTHITTLENGIRVASQETFGQCTTFGILSNAGSRLERPHTMGANHLLGILAFHGTSNPATTSLTGDIQTSLDSIGGVSFANASQDQFLYCIDVLRPNVNQAMDLLKDVVLYPKLDEEDVDYAKKIVEYQHMDILPEQKLGEGLLLAAYQPLAPATGNTPVEYQQLGRPHTCPLEQLPNLNSQILKDFRNNYILNPNEMVIAGAGIDHNHLVDLAEQHFSHLSSPSLNNLDDPLTKVIPSTYTGGEYREQRPTTDGFTRVALAFPIKDGWHSTDDLVPACILQTLLGGGNSFSAGGPGKGMYSRLYREVLNRYYWAESCEAFTSIYNESGLIGLSGSCAPNKSGELSQVLAEHILRLERDLVTDEEMERARNMLKCNVLTQLESRLVLFEDVGRQILTYGKREGMMEMCEKIEAVTKEDLRRVVKKALGTHSDNGGQKTVENMNAPTLSVVGDQIDQVPKQDDVTRWFQMSLF